MAIELPTPSATDKEKRRGLMRISAVAFTAAGGKLAERLTTELCGRGHEISDVLHMYGDEKRESLSDWTRVAFERDEGIVFIGACGIAVRSVAPYLRGKRSDPAVVVIDERGRFAISLLSGHIGGANFLAELAAEILGATPVITTATDINGRFAVDMWAQRQQLILGDAAIARDISAAVLAGGFVGICSDFPLTGTPPSGITPVSCVAETTSDFALGETLPSEITPVSCVAETTSDFAPDEISPCGITPVSCVAETTSDIARDETPPRVVLPATAGELGICVSYDGEKCPFARTLTAIPRRLTLGIGCRRGVSSEVIESAVEATLEECRISFSAVEAVASIDLKADEKGLLEFCEKHSLPIKFFSARELSELEGEFTASEFVNGITGVDNVCERAAIAALESGGRLIVKKHARDGVTVALAEQSFAITYDF